MYNDLEKSFANFLDTATDINKFSALAETFTKFSITYLNKKGGQGLYCPDFIAEQQLKNKTVNWIIETKGYEDENVALKDTEAENWCKIASDNTKQEWRFAKVPDSFFRAKNKKFSSFAQMIEELIRYNKQLGAQEEMKM